MCVCVCVCVCEREREREREKSLETMQSQEFVIGNYFLFILLTIEHGETC